MQYDISMRRCASVAALQKIKDVTRDDAEKIRTIWRTIGNRKFAREQIDNVLRTHGVEYLGQHRRSGNHVYYCNAGDTYSSTVIFAGLRMYVGCWGYLIEQNLVKPAEFV